MAAILGSELGDEFGLPDRAEAVRLAGGGDAGIFGVDEDGPAVAVDGDLMDVDVADGDRGARDVDPVEMLVGALVAVQDVFEAPDLRQPANIEPIALGAHAHSADEILLVEGDLLVAAQAHQEELARLVGGKGNARPDGSQPVREPAGDGKPALPLSVLRGLGTLAFLGDLLDLDARLLGRLPGRGG